MILIGSGRPTLRDLRAAAAGGLIGTIPLAYANYSSWKDGLGFVSLSGVAEGAQVTLDAAVALLHSYLVLGQGEAMGFHILGDTAHSFWPQAEMWLIGAALMFVAFLAFQQRAASRLGWLSGQMGLAYILVAVALFFFPNPTSAHHWIVGTPFHYAAIALAIGAPARRIPVRTALRLAVTLLVVVRLPTVVKVERAFASGKASAAYDPAFLRIGEFAAIKSEVAVFLATDWGTATQIYCLSNGNDGLVHETYWDGDPALAARRIVDATEKDTVYLVASNLVPHFAPAAEAAANAMSSSADWKEAPIEMELTTLAPLTIRKFVRR